MLWQGQISQHVCHWRVAVPLQSTFHDFFNFRNSFLHLPSLTMADSCSNPPRDSIATEPKDLPKLEPVTNRKSGLALSFIAGAATVLLIGGVALAGVSSDFAPYDPTVTYTGSSTDNYANYCSAGSSSPSFCSDGGENACRNECCAFQPIAAGEDWGDYCTLSTDFRCKQTWCLGGGNTQCRNQCCAYEPFDPTLGPAYAGSSTCVAI